MHARRSHLTVVALVVAGWALAAHPAVAQERAGLLAAPAPYGTIPPWTATSATVTSPAPPMPDPSFDAWDPAYAMRAAELHAAPGGGRVLRAAETMIDSGTIVRGSCYDWVDAVFTHASGQRHTILRGGPEHGPYAQTSDFRPGDWVMFVNESFGGDRSHTHSAIFVGWVDESAHVAMMVSYPGGRRDEPGRFGTYDLSLAYRIERMDDAVPPPAHRGHAARASSHAAHGSSHRAHG
jgi:hypothetical protein